MSRKVAVVWHALFSIAAGVVYFFFVIPRWWEFAGDTSHTLGTVLRIVTGALIGLAALPVWFTLQRTRQPEFRTPELALRLQLWSIVLHIAGAVLIIGTAVAEIWVSLDDAGQWLFGIYGAAAAVCLLGMAAFYLSFVAELPPPPPRPLRKKSEKRRGRKDKKVDEADDETDETAADETDDEKTSDDEATEDAEKPDDATVTVAEPDAETVEAKVAEEDAGDSDDKETVTEKSDDDLPTAEDTVAAEAPRAGRRKPRGTAAARRRRRAARGGVAVDE